VAPVSKFLALFISAALWTHEDLLAGEIIAHDSVQLSAAEVRDVFLGERQLLGDMKLVPVDNLAAHAQFLASVLQTDAPKYAARWTRKSFREGLVPPSLKGSDAEVTAFVKATAGAIGYVSTPSTGVKVLGKF
jgi:hypothetical protein